MGAQSILLEAVFVIEELVTSAVKATGVMDEHAHWTEVIPGNSARSFATSPGRATVARLFGIHRASDSRAGGSNQVWLLVVVSSKTR